MTLHQPPKVQGHVKRFVAGIFAALSAGFLALAAMSQFVATESPLGPMMRMLDSLSPWMIGVSVVLAIMVFAFGARIMAALLVISACVGFGTLAERHVQVSLPTAPTLQPEMRILFFNALFENAAFGHRIVEAAIAADPDVLIVAEAEALYPALKTIASKYEILTECTLDACEMLVATRLPVRRFWQLSLNVVWPDRYSVADLDLPSGKSVFVVGNHLLKPWLSGLSETEIRRLGAQYDWLSKPAVVLGDYNMAPWSKPMHDLLTFTGFKTMRLPIPTWPARAGSLGVPIDHVLVHNGARVVAARPFGETLGSNHRGLLVDLALP